MRVIAFVLEAAVLLFIIVSAAYCSQQQNDYVNSGHGTAYIRDHPSR